MIVSYEGGALTSARCETISQMWSVMVGCFGNEPLLIFGCIPDLQYALIFRLGLPVPWLVATTAVMAFVAKNHNWLSNGLRWIPFCDDDSQTDNRRRRETVESDMGTRFNVRVLVATVAQKGHVHYPIQYFSLPISFFLITNFQFGYFSFPILSFLITS